MSDYETSRELTTLFSAPVDSIDPHSYLMPKMRVVGAQSRALGKVQSVERDQSSGKLKSVTVRHGLFSQGHTTVPASRVKWVNEDSVVLDYTRGQFKRI